MSPILTRRRFLAAGATALGAGLIPPAWSSVSRRRLPIPALVDGSRGAPVDLHIREGAWSFRPGVTTPTLGISQQYLGPTIRTRKNTELNLRYKNALGEGVAIHGHGLHVPGEVDGGPQLEMAPGDEWRPSLSIVQPAATCWYHSHTHGKTGDQVYRGLAGMMIIDDDDADALDLPGRYGIDDLPIIIQDRTFDKQGRLVYSLNEAGEDGWLGETVIVNGAIAPVADVPAGKVRLRLLNGANARFYIVTFADQRAFQKIATDGGFLAAPVPMKAMEMAPGERCEIIVDMSDGRPADLIAAFEDEIDAAEEGMVNNVLNLFRGSEKRLPAPALSLRVDRSLTPHTAPLPRTLATIDRPAVSQISRTRDFVLTMEDGGGHAAHAGHAAMDMTINGSAMDMSVINERVKQGVWERWRVRSEQGAHPFHVHGCSFLIERMEGAAAPPDQQGWKDVVVLDDDDWSEFVVRFDHPATDRHPYMYHCHILEHEDRGMMGQFTVT